MAAIDKLAAITEAAVTTGRGGLMPAAWRPAWRSVADLGFKSRATAAVELPLALELAMVLMEEEEEFSGFFTAGDTD